MLQKLISEHYEKSHDLAQRIGYIGYHQVATEILSLTSGMISLLKHCEEENKKLREEIESLKIRLNSK